MYGFSVNVDGNAVPQMRLIEGEMGRMGSRSVTETNRVSESFSKIGNAAKGFLSQWKGLLLGGLAAGGIFGGIHFVESSVEAFNKVEAAVTRVNTVIQSTKGAAGLSGNMIEDQAKQLSKSILAGRSEIMDAQGMLLSFTGIKSPIFQRTTQAVADFATFYKTDMTAAALQIGKALNNPLMGMNRLQRVGVAFTDQQKQQIRNYVQQGNLLAAQKVILDELSTEFGGQAGAAALTDEGKVKMASKQWTSLKLELGEIFSKLQVSLIPAFTTMVEFIKDAFNSAPIQFFLEHLKDLATIALKLLPIWIAYKSVMLTVSAITSILSIKNGILTLSLGKVTIMTEGATLATEGLGAALSTIGLGALIIGLGLVIEKLISLNSKVKETTDGLTHIKDISEAMNSMGKSVDKNDLAFSNVKNLGKLGQSEVYSNISAQLKAAKDQLSQFVEPALKSDEKTLYFKNSMASLAKQRAAKEGIGYTESGVDAGFDIKRLRENVGAEKNAVVTLRSSIKKMTDQLTTMDAMKIKPLHPSAYADGSKANAITTSELGGAKGGLGEAKIINIRIDTLQKNEVKDGTNFKQVSQQGVEELIRTLDNLSYSQGSF